MCVLKKNFKILTYSGVVALKNHGFFFFSNLKCFVIKFLLKKKEIKQFFCLSALASSQRSPNFLLEKTF